MIDAVRRRFTASGALDFLLAMEDIAHDRHWPWEVLAALQEIRGEVEAEVWQRPDPETIAQMKQSEHSE